MKTVRHVDMRKEYRRENLGTGVRGKYYEDYKKGTNLVHLSPDVATAFPNDDSVNNALRELGGQVLHSFIFSLTAWYVTCTACRKRKSKSWKAKNEV